MERAEAEKRLAKLAPVLAELMGWRHVVRLDTPHLAELESPEGFHIFLNAGWKGGYDKLSISGSWPRDSQGRQVMPSYNAVLPKINVSVARPVDVIASEIWSRFLPKYLPLWKEAVERAESDSNYEKERESSAEKLAKIVGVSKSEISNGRFSLYRSTAFPESLSDVEVSGDDVKLELRCSMKDAEQILKTLVKLSNG